MKDRLLYDHDAFGNSIAGISCGCMGLERNVLKKHAASTVASFLSRHCRFHLQSSLWKVVLWITSLSLSARSSSPKSSNTEQRELLATQKFYSQRLFLLKNNYIIQSNLYLFRFEAAGVSALSERVLFRVPEHFAATKICSNQQLLIAIIVEILKEKKLRKYKTVCIRYAYTCLRNA